MRLASPQDLDLELELTLALGGEHLSDIAVVRSEPALYGPVASDPTVSRIIDALATDAPAALKGIDAARTTARAQAWALAGEHAPDHPDAQLRITNIDGLRVTAFATNTPQGGGGHWQLADLKLRYRRRARCRDRIRIAKDTGLRALPLHDFTHQIWIAIVAPAGDLLAQMAMLALTGADARRQEPKRLRLRLFTVPATLTRHARRNRMHYADKHPWATLARDAVDRLQQLPLAVPG